MIKVDTATLSSIISECFDLAADARLSLDQQTAFLRRGQQLRRSLMDLLSARFDDGSVKVLAANEQLEAINETLSNEQTKLENIASTLASIASVAGALDKLLNVAASTL